MILMTKIMTIMTIAHLTSKSRPEARYNAVDQSLLPLVTSLKLLNIIYIFSSFGMITMTIPNVSKNSSVLEGVGFPKGTHHRKKIDFFRALPK